MGKAIVVYASETGNTESVAEEVVKGLEQGGLDVTLKNVEESRPGELSEYDLVLLASSSWGDEEKELHESMVDFYEELEGIDLSGKSAAAFGCGDSEYMYFCGAVDLLEERLEERGAKVLSRNPPLKKGDFRLFSPFGKGVTGGIFQFVNFWI